jgi:hypothetical protein
MRIQCISRPRATIALPTMGTLFSAWHATTHALQPVQVERSIDIAQRYFAPSRFDSSQSDSRCATWPTWRAKSGCAL